MEKGKTVNTNHKVDPEVLHRLGGTLEGLLKGVFNKGTTVSQALKAIRGEVLKEGLRFTKKIMAMTLNELRQQERARGPAGISLRARRMLECMTREWGRVSGETETSNNREEVCV